MKRKENKEKKNTKVKFNLLSMLIVFCLVPLILSISMISILSLYIMKSNLEKGAKNTLFIVANNLASYCMENEINAINAADYYSYLDSLKEQDIEMAIILDGVPCATSIKNENDYRIREIEFKKDIAADKEELENGYYDEVFIDGRLYCAYYMPIKTDNEITGMAFAGELQEHVTGAINVAMLNFVYVAIILVVIFTIIALVFSKKLSKSFHIIGENVNALSAGILSKQKNYTSIVKEMNTLLVETEFMQQNLSETIGKVKDVSQGLVENIEGVTKLSESTTERANQITSVMDKLTASTVGMAGHMQDINEQMQEIGNCVNDISENIECLSGSSENILQTNNEAKINMNTIMDSSEKSVQAVSDITEQIRQTNTSIAEIDKAVELILNISQQTSLLSLNASIEAARAGEFGKGFAVVAEEIRNLSERSAEGAEMIKNLAKEIVEKSQKSVGLVDRVHSYILLEQENVSKTREKYEELSRDINRSVNEIRFIAEKTDHLTGYKERVIENVSFLSAISRENAVSSEEVSANIGEIISEVQSVNVNCKEMNVMAGELQKSVSYFRN